MMTNKYNECTKCINKYTCKHANKYSTCVYSNKKKDDTWKKFYLNRFMRVV